MLEHRLRAVEFAYLTAQGSTAVISPMSRRINLVPFDTEAYKARNIIERAFNRLKDWRAIATRYERRPANYLAGACLAAAFTYRPH